jgi:peptidoglycan/xylan/chitin deacetylase (PgdA/CDA1 family)
VFLCVVLACVCAWLLRIFAGLGVSIAGLAPPTWLLFVLCALLFFLIGLGSFYPPSGIFGRPLLSGPADRPLFALTFDDGPDPGGTRAVLAVLARHGVRATFFIIGERAARHPELVAELAAAGHQIENHSLRHSWATPFLSRFRLAAELKKTQEIVTSASGGARAPRWFRPPIGILSPPVASAARRVGLRLCGWSCKSRDGLSFTGADAALARLKKGLRPGAILLLHDAAERGGHTPVAATVLEALLPIAKERGLRPVTLDELVR